MPDDTRQFSFGFGGEGEGFGLYGWHGPEDGFTWTDGLESALLLPRLQAPNGWFVEVCATPFNPRGLLGGQRMTIAVDGCYIGGATVHEHKQTLAFFVPPSVTPLRGAGIDHVLVTIGHPDAGRPSELESTDDTRLLALSMSGVRIQSLAEPRWPSHVPIPDIEHIALSSDDDAAIAYVERLLGITAAELVTRFESLGENCEFGLLQRRCGAEPLGLLRFSSAFLHRLLEALNAEFVGLGDELEVTVGRSGHEWMSHDRRYAFEWHTRIHPTEASGEQVHAGERARAKLLRRRLLEDLQTADKIFVYQRPGLASVEEVMPLFLALRRRGPNTLLWVAESDEDHPPGSVEVVSPGLLRGNIDRFGGRENGTWEISIMRWLEILVQAVNLRQAARGHARLLVES
jgi:hypothetical protein